ncbi:MAG: hypothetical protein ACRD1P_10415 [Thermoanaerobaculia bacterium]
MTIKGVHFVSDATGKKTGVLIDLKRHRRQWEDLYDVMVAAARKSEPRIPWDTVKQRLNGRQKRRA